MKQLFRNKLVLTSLIIGILLRLVVAFSTSHPDTQVFIFSSRILSITNFLSLYDYKDKILIQEPSEGIYPNDLFIYPPAIYLYFTVVTKPLVSLFSDNFVSTYITNIRYILGRVQLNIMLMLFKTPYIIFDVGIALLLTTLFTDFKKKVWAFSLWMLNPVALFSAYAMGQFDIIALFFVILSMYTLKREDLTKSHLLLEGALLGLGAAFKIFPLFLLLPLSFLKPKIWQKMAVVGAGLGVYVLTILPFLSSPGFRASALLAGHTMKSFYAAISVSGQQSFMLFPALLIFLYLIFYFSKNSVAVLWKKYLLVLLLFFMFTHSHPQWFLWLTPFLVIELVESKFIHWMIPIGMIICYFLSLTFFDPSLTTHIFAPLKPSLINLNGFWETLGMQLKYNYSRSLVHSVFVGLSIFYFYLYLPKINDFDSKK